MAGGSSLISKIEPLIELTLPENIIYQDERKFIGNLAFTIDQLYTPSLGYRKLQPVEIAYASTENLPNSTFIILDRYPLLPYWNRYYSHPYIEDMAKFLYTKPNAHHVYRYYNNAVAHIMTEDTANDVTGYKLAHSVVAFTY